MSGGEGFLTRWSRLKREPEPAKPEVGKPEDAGAPPDTPPDLAQSVEEIVAALPKIEELVPGQSLAAFMQKGVPVDLKNAALRRMWTIDPAIRDFASEALDYAYDYNTPGAAPGFGPMVTSPEAVREVLAMFDKAMPASDRQQVAQETHDNLPQAPSVKGNVIEADAAMQQAVVSSVAPDEARAGISINPAPALDLPRSEPPDASAALQKTTLKTNSSGEKPKRHGGALPR